MPAVKKGALGRKKGAAHHFSGLGPKDWAKAKEDKVAPKVYVPTGKPRGRIPNSAITEKREYIKKRKSTK